MCIAPSCWWEAQFIHPFASHRKTSRSREISCKSPTKAWIIGVECDHSCAKFCQSPRGALNPLKLVIQIPCFNEESSLASTLASLPRDIPGVKEIEILVIDDGSGDRTAEIARASGATVYSQGAHRGLAAAFSAGLREALVRGADIVVNTDADNQYEAADILLCTQPILTARAEVGVGDRKVCTEEYFSPTKLFLGSCGRGVGSIAVGAKIPDATSGSRAFSRANRKTTRLTSSHLS